MNRWCERRESRIMHLHGSVESETRKVDWNRETPINEIREQLSHLVDFRLSRHTQQLIHHQVNGHLHNDLSIRLSYILNPIKLNYLLLRLDLPFCKHPEGE